VRQHFMPTLNTPVSVPAGTHPGPCQPKKRTASSSWIVSVAAPLVDDTVREPLGLESVMVTTLSSLSVPSQAQVKGALWLV
jgi:hypothetical protein